MLIEKWIGPEDGQMSVIGKNHWSVERLIMFERMLKAIKTQCWNDATHEGLDSRWAKQTPERAERQMKTLLTGTWSEYE